MTKIACCSVCWPRRARCSYTFWRALCAVAVVRSSDNVHAVKYVWDTRIWKVIMRTKILCVGSPPIPHLYQRSVQLYCLNSKHDVSNKCDCFQTSRKISSHPAVQVSWSWFGVFTLHRFHSVSSAQSPLQLYTSPVRLHHTPHKCGTSRKPTT